jgi:hypothetical protein
LIPEVAVTSSAQPASAPQTVWWKKQYLTLAYRLNFLREFAFHLHQGLSGEKALAASIQGDADYARQPSFQQALAKLNAGEDFAAAMSETGLIQRRDLQWLANDTPKLSVSDRLDILLGRLERTAKFWNFSLPNFWFYWAAFLLVGFTLLAYGHSITPLADETSVWSRFIPTEQFESLGHLVWLTNILVNMAFFGIIAIVVYIVGFFLYVKTKLGSLLSPFIVTRSLLYRFLVGDVLFVLAQLVRLGFSLPEALAIVEKNGVHPLLRESLNQSLASLAAGDPTETALGKLLPNTLTAGSAEHYHDNPKLADWLQHLAERTIMFSSNLYATLKLNVKLLTEVFIVFALLHVFWTTQTLTNISVHFSMESLAASARALHQR